VHSNEQIIASLESGASGMLQFSHVGLSSSMAVFGFKFARRLDLAIEIAGHYWP